jgi:polyisoprenoid-binding protein YceI
MGDSSTKVEMPPEGTWTLDPNHTVIGAVARHLMVTKVRGKFNVFSGAIHVGSTPESSWAELEIDAGSIDSGVPDRDTHLRSADFLDVEHHPRITYKSTQVVQTGPTTLRVTGDLTIRDVTRSMVLEVGYEGMAPDPWGGTRAAFSATGELEREEWEMTWNVALEAGGVLVSKTIQLEIEAQAVEQEGAIDRAAEEESKPEGDTVQSS